MKVSTLFNWLVTLAILTLSATLSAEVKLPNVIGSGMVLQRDLPVPIWGWAEAGEKVTVSFAGQTKTAKADDDGKWMVKLDKLKVSAEAANLTVKGSNEITLDNVLVGEVWICSGQSNMEWRLSGAMNGKEEVAAADHPLVRLFDVPGHKVSPQPKERLAIPSSWKVCSPQTSGGFSAVGYFFGRRLQKELDIPIGLIGSISLATHAVTLAAFRGIGDTRTALWITVISRKCALR